MKRIDDRFGKVLELVFKITFLSLALATFNSFLYVSAIQPILVKAALILGVLLIVVRMTNFKTYLKIPGVILMILFCISFAFSSFMNRQYELVGNLKWVLWTGILFFSLYLCNPKRKREDYRKEFYIVSHILIIYTSISAVIGIGMLVTGYSAVPGVSGGETTTAGFNWGRLWGVYTDPNYGAVISGVAVILSIMFFLKKKKVIPRAGYTICMILNFLYIVFSDSRTGIVTLACCIAVYLYLWFIYKNRDKSTVKRYGMAVIVCACAAVLTLGGTYLVKKEYNRVLAPVFKEMFVQKQIKPTTPKKPKPTVGRKGDLEKDVSNGRLALWESAFEIWKESPVYGVGYTSLVPYCKENIPDTYAVNNSQTDYTSMHNAFLNTLVFQGAIGFVLLILIAGRILIYCIPAILKTKTEDYLDLTAMLTGVTAIGISMMFLLEGTYTNSPGSFVLWVFSGYMVQTVYQEKTEKCISQSSKESKSLEAER